MTIHIYIYNIPEETKFQMYKLIKIVDSKSQYKSQFAKDICSSKLREEYGIQYFEATITSQVKKCENNLYRKKIVNDVVKVVSCGGKRCNTTISDKFIIQHTTTGDELIVGNNCIQLFFQAGVLTGIAPSEFETIIKCLKVINPCLLCGKRTSRTIHKKCLRGECSGNYIVSETQVLHKIELTVQIPMIQPLKKLISVIPGYSLVERTEGILFKGKYGRVDKSTLAALEVLCGRSDSNYIDDEVDHLVSEDLINERSGGMNSGVAFLLEHEEKLSKLKNNCIVKSVRKQRRGPSIKQLAILEKIIRDFDRIFILDIENKNRDYQKWGYTYK
jgi:hypothetical protein